MASIFDKIRADYDALRRENERILYERRQEAYAMAPGLEEVEDNIRNLGFEAAKATLLSGDGAVKDAAVEELKTYEAMARALLTEAGLPPNYLDPIYSCEKCKDKGYFGRRQPLQLHEAAAHRLSPSVEPHRAADREK